MSDFGALMDRVVVAAEAAVSGLDAERENDLVKNLAPSAFPHLFVYDASERVAPASHQQRQATVLIRARLITRDETQEAFLLKRDAIRDGIEADATLLSLSTDVYVGETETFEDPKTTDKFAEMVIVVEQES